MGMGKAKFSFSNCVLIILLLSGQTFSYKEEERTCIKKIVNALGLNLLKDLTYVHITFGLALGYVSSISFSTFYPMFLQDEVKFDVMSTTYCMTSLSLSDVIGRITSAELCRRLNLGNRSSFMLGCFFLGVSRSCKLNACKYFLFQYSVSSLYSIYRGCLYWKWKRNYLIHSS